MKIPDPLLNEIDIEVFLLCGHLSSLTKHLRKIPANKWDWQPNPMTPSARIIAAHAWQWLVCDRQHITEPDVLKHSNVPQPPADPQEMCNILQEEIENWYHLISSLTPERLLERRYQFDNKQHPLNIRWFIAHMTQNVIYKLGQLSMIYFMLGLDGTGPYTAPFPNQFYDEMRAESEEEEVITS